MKWYSIKKYRVPANIGFIFVALEVECLCVYKLAEFRHNLKTDEFSWFDEQGYICSQVTHFCIPDPIEIE